MRKFDDSSVFKAYKRETRHQETKTEEIDA
jgi:hypothetical protein